ncbi:Spc98p [Sporobolomyces koalae]|uniref:Spc98p n=1 Tax=Sporobolomyces koalae TaxID=500713 RepID=UPI003179060B
MMHSIPRLDNRDMQQSALDRIADMSTALPQAGPSRINFFPAPSPLKPLRPFVVPSSLHSSADAAGSSPRPSSRLPMAALLAEHRSALSANSAAGPPTLPQSDCGGTLLPPVPEADLLRDILYIFQGIDGQFIRFKTPTPRRPGPKRTFTRGEIVTDGVGVIDPLTPEEELEQRRQQFGAEAELEEGIGFVELRKRGFSLPAPTRTLLHQLSELGWLYRKIETALLKSAEGRNHSLSIAARQARSRTKGKSKGDQDKPEPIGMIEQSLHAELQKEMTSYFELVSVLESKLDGGDTEVELSTQQSRAADDTSLFDAQGLTGRLTLRKLDVWTQDIRLRMRMMGTLVSEVGGANVGGAFLTTLHAYTSNGDPFIRNFSARLLKTLSRPFFSTLSSWIYHGELRDPYSEFFVELNPALGNEGDERWKRRGGTGYDADNWGNNSDVQDERGVPSHELWGDKFSFRKDMLPGFLEESFGRKIFSTGKSLNFMKYSCADSAWIIDRHQQEDQTLEYADMASLERSISLAYSTASQRLFELFFEKFRLMDHLRALKDYLMLGKGDFCEILMEQLGPSLGRPANTLYRHNLTSTLETAIRGSLPPASLASPHSLSVLRRLDARISDFQQGEVGWDVFLLEYKVDAPLSTILDPRSLEDYREMFKHLWGIKRVEYVLNEAWKTLMTSSRLLKKGSIVSFALHQARTALSKMIFFVRQVEYYCHLEVIACQWAELEEFVARKEGDLDKLIEAHKRYLAKLLEKGLLKVVSKRSKKEPSLKLQLESIFVTMLAYKNAADDLFAHAMQLESHARSAQDSARGLPSPVLSSRPPSTQRLYDIETLLISHSEQFQTSAENFVSSLEKSPDLDMKFLAVRLNFNFQFRSEPTGAKSEA